MRVRAVLARLVAVVLGVWVGVTGSVVHRAAVDVAGVDLPWGLALSLGTVVAVAWACDRRIPVGGAWFGLGWTVVLLGQQLQTSGSYLVASDALGWGYLLGGMGACAAVVLLAPRLER